MIYKREIAIKDMNWAQASRVAQALVEEGYAVMLTQEENLIIINYDYAAFDSGYADRNNMVFVSRDTFDLELDEFDD